jgi:hypothetical protein
VKKIFGDFFKNGLKTPKKVSSSTHWYWLNFLLEMIHTFVPNVTAFFSPRKFRRKRAQKTPKRTQCSTTPSGTKRSVFTKTAFPKAETAFVSIPKGAFSEFIELQFKFDSSRL